ncbi:uncharacterized protein LOC135167519 isoform X2 [Diachasmimorpha longicaudata]|uniref:uncharacterized protein LOC135167519 isoform X2 n=1 Tax=Diachasmimorpha longicaudata TaxID=58733 RepID=UPI0030B8EB66
MKLSFITYTWIFVLLSTVLCKTHRSSRIRRNHGRRAINFQARHYRNDSLLRKKRADSYLTQNPLKEVQSIILEKSMNNSTNAKFSETPRSQVQLGELAKIFGITEKTANITNFNDFPDTDSFEKHVRVKRDNPDFNEVVNPIPDEPVELHLQKSSVDDDDSISKNHFEDIYPDSAGLIDYDTPLTRVLKTKREIRKESPSVVDKNVEDPKSREKRKKSCNKIGDLADVHENELVKSKLNLKTIQTRSIEEAKELASKLVAKVNEIENLMDGSSSSSASWNETTARVMGHISRPERFANYSDS